MKLRKMYDNEKCTTMTKRMKLKKTFGYNNGITIKQSITMKIC